jgi:hypothetical protein
MEAQWVSSRRRRFIVRPGHPEQSEGSLTFVLFFRAGGHPHLPAPNSPLINKMVTSDANCIEDIK